MEDHSTFLCQHLVKCMTLASWNFGRWLLHTESHGLKPISTTQDRLLSSVQVTYSDVFSMAVCSFSWSFAIFLIHLCLWTKSAIDLLISSSLLGFSFFWDGWGECMHFLGKYPLMDLVSVCLSSHSFVLIWSISLLPASVHLLLKCFKVSGIYSLWRLLFLEMLQHQLQPTSLLRSKLFWSTFIKPHMQQLLKGSVLLPGLKLPEEFCLHNKSCKLYTETLIPIFFWSL